MPRTWRHIRRGTISSREAVESCHERIDAVNPHLNAIVFADRQRALLDADVADRQVRSHQILGPLHGVPVTIKLNVDVEGEATTNGVPAFAENESRRVTVPLSAICEKPARLMWAARTHRRSRFAGLLKTRCTGARSTLGMKR